MTASRWPAALLLAGLLAGCSAAEDAARSASEATSALPDAPSLPAVEMPSGERLEQLAKDVEGVAPEVAADPQALARGAAEVCARVAAGQDTTAIVQEAKGFFGGAAADLSPEQTQQLVDAVQSAVCR
ncbi:hypothetical protein CLV92_106245 [Kineococcus xinjiangensis]|uniref:DUF732 domain-containing protein n=1 Tax=Kineococcus xinjiangensis TaxID=512762 RepID=A0A2S6IMD7_9ACTN|nr:hypothetical protein [Kineococcus xinjiangensis]PPK95422.1 hypothetical protein CLV92_106245 [Kineococcus xinjiangensis]